MPYHRAIATVVAFHAHPDDEVLLTGRTLAGAVAEGHRVVIVVATDGVVTALPEALPTRMRELGASAAALGVHRVEHLGYADSGHGAELYPDPPDRVRFVRADTWEAAGRLATILREESADVLLSHDQNGGYGHRDHVKVVPGGIDRVPAGLPGAFPSAAGKRTTRGTTISR